MATDPISERMRRLPLESRWRRQERPVAGVLTLIQRQFAGVSKESTRYLLIRRKQEPFAGRWALVGGKIEFGETIAEAAVREVFEETGLATHFVALRAVVNERLTPDAGYENAGHWLLFICAVSAPHGKAEERDEGPLAWFTRPDLDALIRRNEVIPSDYEMIVRFAAAERTVPFVESVIEAQAEDQQQVQLSQFNIAPQNL